jgi:N6-L-threonylcarbamoyladenine synthase
MILSIESSCDESSVALVAEGPRVIAEITATQIEMHEKWGGVVPELASRAHQEVMLPLIKKVMQGQSWDDVKAIAVANCPGLMGPLLVGVTFAKSLAFSLNKPFMAVNHLEGHLASVCLENIAMPSKAIGLLVSGGHTLFLKRADDRWTICGGTRDDASGEAFDKGARLLGLPYPGGRLLSELAAEGDDKKIAFPVSSLPDNQVSFSGLKSELRRRLDKGLLETESKADVAAGYQKAIVDTLMKPLTKIIQSSKAKALIVAGGVSCNSLLRQRCQELCDQQGIELLLPQPKWGTDNAAMIAAAAWPRFKKQDFDSLDVAPSPRINPRLLLERSQLQS